MGAIVAALCSNPPGTAIAAPQGVLKIGNPLQATRYLSLCLAGFSCPITSASTDSTGVHGFYFKLLYLVQH